MTHSKPRRQPDRRSPEPFPNREPAPAPASPVPTSPMSASRPCRPASKVLNIVPDLDTPTPHHLDPQSSR